MYVTRRLLRSTLPPEPEKENEVSYPPLTPRRRAAVRASAKIEEAVADTSGPARTKAKSENGGDEKNKRKKKKEEEKNQKEEEVPAIDVSSLHGYQLMVDVHYRGEQYAEARILDLDPEKQLVFVHYMGWNARFDAWISVEKLAAHGSHSGVAKKKDVSWDGSTPLFANEEEVAAHRQGGKVKPKKSQKKRTALSPKARQAARKALRSVNTDCKEVEEVEEPQLSAKQKSPKSAKKSKKQPTKSPRSAKKSPSRRAPRRVQVAVSTTHEDVDGENEDEAADLVLDVDIEGHEANEDEEYEEPSSRKRKKSQRKESPGASKRKRESSQDDVEESTGDLSSPANSKKPKKPAKTAPLPPLSAHGGLGSATKEKLAAIFRQRIQERQQLEQLNASDASFQQTLQDPVEPADTSNTEETEANSTVANAELAAAEEYQRQLQHYYYQQQVMLTNSLSMRAAGEDPSSIPLQGGIMDPRIIQERLTALEERRRQQAHVQAYYHQLMLTRERNVRALAANQAFMAASAAVWEQQLKETQSEDGTSSVNSWKDVTDADASKPELTDKSPTSEAGDKSDNESGKESEASSATSTKAAVTSPDTVEKAQESAKTSPTKSEPADSPKQGVLYEFVL